VSHDNSGSIPKYLSSSWEVRRSRFCGLLRRRRIDKRMYFLRCILGSSSLLQLAFAARVSRTHGYVRTSPTVAELFELSKADELLDDLHEWRAAMDSTRSPRSIASSPHVTTSYCRSLAGCWSNFVVR
jgi:hypothetical protein